MLFRSLLGRGQGRGRLWLVEACCGLLSSFYYIMEIITQSNYKTTTWEGGVTRQVFISPSDGDLSARCFDVRISSAIIDSVESEFSDFSGFTRYILPLEGEITLIKDNQRIMLSHNALYEFEGHERVYSENTRGAVDFNVIVRHGVTVDVRILSDESFVDSPRTVLFALEDCCVNAIAIHRHDTVLLDGPFSLEGKAVVVRVGG